MLNPKQFNRMEFLRKELSFFANDVSQLERLVKAIPSYQQALNDARLRFAQVQREYQMAVTNGEGVYFE